MEAFLRAIVSTVPEFRVALQIQDCICYVFKATIDFIIFIIVSTFRLTYKFVVKLCSSLSRLCRQLPFIRPAGQVDYKRIKTKRHKEPIPYENSLFKRSLTYYGGIVLGALLYLFVYYVLVKHHTYTSISVAFLLFMAYLIILENSHNIRSIMMLCLPIMFTNRGRALVFCCMLAILIRGPLQNARLNIGQLHLSINCCKQYMIIKTDKAVEENVVQNIVRAEEIVYKLMDDIKAFADGIKERARVLVELAITVEKFIEESVRKLLDIVDVCNAHTHELYTNCRNIFQYAYQDCRNKLGGGLDVLCEIVAPLHRLCELVKLPNVLCYVPQALIKFIDSTVGERLRYYMIVIQNEFYIEVEIDHDYSYNATKSKSYAQVVKSIQSDIAAKFRYFRMIARIFNMISLILVIWIIVTATLYHLHYLEDIKYDNMYLDGYLHDIEKRRKRDAKRRKSNTETSNWTLKDAEDETLLTQDNLSLENNSEDSFSNLKMNKDEFLFPMTKLHRKKYFEPFSIWMNDFERSKLFIAGFVWSIIIGYIMFFVLVDYTLYQLIQLVNNILNSILFKSDLPLVDVMSLSGNQTIRYNRTYLTEMRTRAQTEWQRRKTNLSYRNGSLSSMYRRLMDSIEEKIPDDIAILDTLQQCLPKANEPSYKDYYNLLYLAAFTLIGVVLEAYALRTRHCIANLYYPVRARKRAIWLYQRLIADKPKYERLGPEEEDEANRTTKLLQLGAKVLEARRPT